MPCKTPSAYHSKTPWVHPAKSFAWLIGVVALIAGCSTQKNTASSRWYHQLTTRYNVYFNGENAYQAAYNQQIAAHKEGYALRLVPDVVRNRKADNASTGGAFDKAVEKGRKAIRMHSIRVKPEMRTNPATLSASKKAFYDQKEFNSFLYKAWFLVGKSQYNNGDLLEAMSTFGYMARLYSNHEAIRNEARIWQARCYVALGWHEDALRIWEGIPSVEKTQANNPNYTMAKAEKALSEENLAEAVRFVAQSLAQEKNSTQKARLYYLLGQLQSELGQWQEARRSFAKALGQSPPYPLAFSSRLRQIEIDARKDAPKAIRSIDREARRSRNLDYLDILYLSQGRIFLSRQDTVKATQAFRRALDKSAQKGADYAEAAIQLGEIYFLKRDWIGAQKAFSKALSTLDKNHKTYKRVAHLSSHLDALAENVKQVQEEDSLLWLAQLPEPKRLQIIDSAIVAYREEQKKLEKEAQREQIRQEQEAFNQAADAQEGRPSRTQSPTPVPAGSNGKFYFFNPPLVEQGKRSFEKKWGKRPLEDDWRRRRKALDLSAPDPATSEPSADNNAMQDEGQASNTDTLSNENNPLERAYYLARIPFSPEAQAEAHTSISQAMEKIGEILNERLELFLESIDAYEQLLSRYPDYTRRKEVMYTLYMLYSRIGQPQGAQRWRQRLMALHPEDPLAIALQDPNYIARLRQELGEEEALYARLLDNYLKGNSHSTETTYQEFVRRFPLSTLLPQVSFIRAMNYVLQGKADLFARELQHITQEYPKADITPLVESMASGLKNGRRIYQTGYSGIDRTQRLEGNSSANASQEALFAIGKPQDSYRVLLLFPRQAYDQKALMFAVGGYNFSQFTRYTLDIAYESRENIDWVSTSGFPNASSAWKYVQEASSPKGYLRHLDKQTLLVAISEENYKQWLAGASLWEYISFVQEHLTKPYPQAVLAVERYHALFDTPTTDPNDKGKPSLKPDRPVDFGIQREGYTSTNTPDPATKTPEEEVKSEPSQPQYTIETGRNLTLEDMRKLELERKAKERQAQEEAKRLQKEKEKAQKERLRNSREKTPKTISATSQKTPKLSGAR